MKNKILIPKKLIIFPEEKLFRNVMDLKNEKTKPKTKTKK